MDGLDGGVLLFGDTNRLVNCTKQRVVVVATRIWRGLLTASCRCWSAALLSAIMGGIKSKSKRSQGSEINAPRFVFVQSTSSSSSGGDSNALGCGGLPLQVSGTLIRHGQSSLCQSGLFILPPDWDRCCYVNKRVRKAGCSSATSTLPRKATWVLSSSREALST